MKTIIIIAIIFLIAFFWLKSKINKTKANPIEAINFAGCMGINLGDSWKLVLSRMKHLNLISKEKFLKYHKEYEEYIGDPFMEICVGCFSIEEHFNNIQDLEFVIRNGVLNHINITLAGEQHDVDTITKIVKNKITRRFGSPIENTDGNHFFMWLDRKTGRMLILSDVDHTLSLSAGVL